MAVASGSSTFETLGMEHRSSDDRRERDFSEHLAQRRLSLQVERQRDQYRECNQKIAFKLRHARAEVERLRQDNDRLRAENDMLIKRNKLNGPGCSSLRYAPFLLPKFDGSYGSRATCWIETITRAASALCWTDAQTMHAVQSSLDGWARDWLMAQSRNVRTWAQFKTAFEKRYLAHPGAAVDVRMTLGGVTVADSKEAGPDGQLLAAEWRMKQVWGSQVKTCYNCKAIGHEYAQCTAYESGGLLRVFIVFALICFAQVCNSGVFL
ncbi:hypothetical protein QAD02_008938 [Eretmocerus hayati]|uniref:Uncharacterized protein n=1 Tax=Eretmocerus hayati TaxID=131215 RepID=A0ACC2N8Q0_9HYME|nr:hypothetical protein QAD02_008938 [Eretmocerus hayati]